MLAVDNLTKNFSSTTGFVAGVKDVSFQVAPKEIYALIGPNGAGKTTTIKTIVGLYRKDSGRITLNGEDITLDDSKTKTKIGYIPDEPNFYPYLSGWEILDFVRLLYKVREEIYNKRLKELLALFPLGSILVQSPNNYSRGNKQKLSIICSLIHQPLLLVVDEPIVGLDPGSSETVARLFQGFAGMGGMILVSTHTLSFVEKVATKIGIIDRGEMICEGNVSQVVNKAKDAKNLPAAFTDLVRSHKTEKARE